jgi:hypothetical protein
MNAFQAEVCAQNKPMHTFFSSTGLRLSRKVMESVVRKYGGKKRRLAFEDFILCASRITVLYGMYSSSTW